MTPRPGTYRLDHVRVVELSHMVAVPVAGSVLADLGAEVTKVEPPEGDAARWFGETDRGMSDLFRSFNRGKRSVVLDLRTDEARAAMDALLDRADVLITNYRGSALDRLGLGERRLQERHPRLVVVHVVAYPGAGADVSGVDVNAVGLSGLMAASGWPDDPPVRPAISMADMTAGLMAAIAVLSELATRSDDGPARHVQVSLTESALYMTQALLTKAASSGQAPPRLGNGSPFGFTGCFHAADAWVTLAAPSDRLFARLCAALGHPSLAERFGTHHLRRAHREELEAEISELVATLDADELVAVLRGAGVPAGRVRTALEAFDDPDIAASGFLTTDVGDAGAVVALPWLVDGARSSATRRDAPTLGRDTDEVLAELLPDADPRDSR